MNILLLTTFGFSACKLHNFSRYTLTSTCNLFQHSPQVRHQHKDQRCILNIRSSNSINTPSINSEKMKLIDQEKIQQYQSQASSNAIKAFFLGILFFVFLLTFNLFFFHENPTSRFTTYSAYILLIVALAVVAPRTKKTGDRLKSQIKNEFSIKTDNFQSTFAYGMLSTNQDTKKYSSKYHKQQIFMSSLTGYFLANTILAVIHFSSKN